MSPRINAFAANPDAIKPLIAMEEHLAKSDLGHTLIELVKPRADVRHVIFHSYDTYTTNVPLADFAADDVLLAFSPGGAEFASGSQDGLVILWARDPGGGWRAQATSRQEGLT